MARIPLRLGIKDERSCDGCTRCCEGWLSANIKGEEMYPGKPCQFVDEGVGCKDYKGRPKNPCKTFACMWKLDPNIPEKFKPSEINAIITKYDVDGIPFLAAVRCGEELDQEFLSWFVTFGVGNGFNIRWEAKDQTYAMGHPEFLKRINLPRPIDNQF